MKKSLCCPKCDGRVLLHVERVQLPVFAGGNMRNLAPLPISIAPPRVFRAPKSTGGFEVFICRSCGFTEWYADGADAIDPAQHPGVRVLDNTPKATLR